MLAFSFLHAAFLQLFCLFPSCFSSVSTAITRLFIEHLLSLNCSLWVTDWTLLSFLWGMCCYRRRVQTIFHFYRLFLRYCSCATSDISPFNLVTLKCDTWHASSGEDFSIRNFILTSLSLQRHVLLCTKSTSSLGHTVIHFLVSVHLSGKRTSNADECFTSTESVFTDSNARLHKRFSSSRMVHNIRFEQDSGWTSYRYCPLWKWVSHWSPSHLGSFRETIQQWNCAADWRIRLFRGKCHL